MVKTISSRSSSRVSEQVDDQGMRDGKGVHTIIGIHVITSRMVQRSRVCVCVCVCVGGGGGVMAANTSMVR